MRVALLLDEVRVSAWVQAVIVHVQSSPQLELALVVLPKAPVVPVHKQSFFYRLFHYTDRFFFTRSPSAFVRNEIKLASVPIVSAEVVSKGFSNFISDASLAEIAVHRPDVFIRFGFGIIRGKILSLATHGMWSLHHGDSDVNRGGPPGFWEWYDRNPVTGVTLQRLNESLDGGSVVAKEFAATDVTSVFRNQNRIFWTGVGIINRALDGLASGNIKPRRKIIPLYSHRLYRNPGTFASFNALRKLLARALLRSLNRLFLIDQWQLFYYVGKGDAFSMRNYKRLTPPKDRFWADPMPVATPEGTCIFFEEYFWKKRKGVISCMMLDDKGKPTASQVVLEPPYHVSYPFLFRYSDRLWMIPESAANRTVDLYECTKFPTEWKHRKTLMEKTEAFDTTVHEEDGTWWMFQTRRENPGQSPHEKLYLFYSDNPLEGSWVSHPCNPIATGPWSRPAGKLFKHDKVLYRPSQVCTPRYGYAINFYEIKTLTKEAYEEVQVSKIEPQWTSRLLGTHTFNFDAGIFVTDAQVRRFRL